MHILIIHQAFASIDEAGGTRHHEFARELAKAGHRVTILASPVSYLSGKSSGIHSAWVTREQDGDLITILRCYTYAALHRSFVHRVFSFLSFMFSSFWIGLGVPGVNLVWGTSPPIFQGVTAWLLARLKGARFLFEVRDLWPAFAIAVGVLQNKTLISLSEWLERLLYRRADWVMVNSPGFIDHIRTRGGKYISLIPNGADPSMFEWNGDLSFRQNNNLNNKFVVLYAGAHGLSNDLNVVLSAADQLKDDDRIQFIMVGDGKKKINWFPMPTSYSLKTSPSFPVFKKVEWQKSLPEQMPAWLFLNRSKCIKPLIQTRCSIIWRPGNQLFC